MSMIETSEQINMVSSSTNDVKYIASFIKNASEKKIVQSAMGFASGTYSRVSNAVKPVCPEVITSKWEAAEQYILDNQHAVVEKTDEYVSKASKFVSDANDARVNSGATDFILSSVEGLVYDESAADETELPQDDQRDASVSRIFGITGAVTNKFYTTATSGLDNLRARSSAMIVHVDLMSYAHQVIDSKVKPSFDVVAGLPVALVDKFNVYAVPMKTKTVAAVHYVHNTTQDTIITPCKNAIAMYSKDGKTFAEVSVYLKNSCHVTWNDRFVVPVAAYLEVPNLHFSTLKPLVVEFGSQKYAMVNDFGTKYLAEAKEYGSGLVVVVTEGATYFLDMCTDRPVAMYKNLADTLSAQYVTFTGVQFHFSTAPLIVYDMLSSKSGVIFAVLSEKYGSLISGMQAEKAKMD